MLRPGIVIKQRKKTSHRWPALHTRRSQAIFKPTYRTTGNSRSRHNHLSLVHPQKGYRVLLAPPCLLLQAILHSSHCLPFRVSLRQKTLRYRGGDRQKSRHSRLPFLTCVFTLHHCSLQTHRHAQGYGAVSSALNNLTYPDSRNLHQPTTLRLPFPKSFPEPHLKFFHTHP